MDIYNIKARYALIMNLVEEADGEIDEHIANQLDSLMEDRLAFIDSLCSTIKQSEYDIRVLNMEVERLSERKDSSVNKIDRTKKLLIDVLKYFEMKSPNKKSKGYAFTTPLFNGYTTVRSDYKFDDAQLEKFNLKADGIESKFIDYKLLDKFDYTTAKALDKNDLLRNATFIPSINKVSAKAYLKANDKGIELTFDESNEIVIDPIATISTLETSESLTVK